MTFIERPINQEHTRMAKKGENNVVDLKKPPTAPPKKAEKKVIRIISESAQLKHINQRTEGPKESPVLALDLKFECIVAKDLLQALCGSDDVPALWNEDGSVRYLGISEFTSRAQLKDCSFLFGDLTGKIELSGVKTNKFRFNPVQGHGLNLILRVQVSDPEDEDFLAISHAALTKGQLEIQCELGVIMGDDKEEKDPDLLDGQEQDEE